MLSAKKVERCKTPGGFRDHLVRGWLLQVSKSGAKSFVLRYELHGREHMIGLGSASEFSLKQARERAREARRLLADHIDPLAARRAARDAADTAAVQRVLAVHEAIEDGTVEGR